LVTRRIMEEFYWHALANGASPADALRQAQLAARRGDLSMAGSTSAPKFWAAWVISASP